MKPNISLLVPAAMPYCRRALVLFLLFTIISNFETDALRCRLYHRIWEDGHLLRITPDICHTSSQYCVRATYSDPDQRKKNGYSMGCDKVDCQGINDPTYTGWTEKPNGEVCRKSRDYGKKGEICCCPNDMCNSAQNSFLPSFHFILVILPILYLRWY